MKIRYRKILKMSILLVSSLLIATASAQYYRYLTISGGVSISKGGLAWIKGTDITGIATVSIATSTASVSLTLNNGTAYNLTRLLYLKNSDTTSHDVVINVTDAADPGYYDTFEIRIYDNSTGTRIGTLNALSTSSSVSGTIDQQVVWHITFYIITKSGAETQSDSFALRFAY